MCLEVLTLAKVTIYIDGAPHEVEDGQNLLEACVELRLNVPYFCWHPAMGSAGACRQCAVTQYANEQDTRGRIVMSCMTPVQKDMRISLGDAGSTEFRESVIEGLMTNHPHDCPVCDEGGECHLQDMTLMTGHDYRSYRFEKRTYRNQDLGPFINHEMNRCIQCYRCVRFYRDYAGGEDLQEFASKNHVSFGRFEDGALESEFSGNLVEVCPTGVFTDASQKQHYTRRWDLSMSPSVCQHCGVGCNITPGERYGAVRRVRNRYNGEVNGFFLCDRGRYGYEFINSEKRVRKVLRRVSAEAIEKGQGPFEEISKADALKEIGTLLKDRNRVIGVGSGRASIESNFALRELVGEDRFFMAANTVDHGLTQEILDILCNGGVETPSLRDIGEAEAVLVLGEDLTNVAPMMALQVRQAVRNVPRAESRKLGIPDWNDIAVREVVQQAKGPFYSATVDATKLDDVATKTLRAAPQDIARLGYAIAHAIDSTAPDLSDLDDATRSLAAEIAAALRGVKNAVIISGPSLRSEEVVRAAANVAFALQRNGHAVKLAYTALECNTMGLGLLDGGTLDQAAQAIREGKADTLVVLESNLFRHIDEATVDAMLSGVKTIISLVHTIGKTSSRAHYLLPVGTFAESDGTVVNNEGRAQRHFQAFVPEGDIQESWRWLFELQQAAGREGLGTEITLDLVLDALAAKEPDLAEAESLVPDAMFRIGGRKIPRQSHRYSGRTAMRANIKVSEDGVPQDTDSPYGFTMEGFGRKTPPQLVASFWSPGWNSPQAVTRFQEEVGGPLRGGDPGVRLIEPEAGEQLGYYTPAAAAFVPKTNERLIVPLYHIYGSDELSALSPPVAERAPAMLYVAVNAEDGEALQAMRDGDSVELTLNDQVLRLPIRLRPDLPKGTVGLPVGLAGQLWRNLPAMGVIRRGGSQ